MAKEVTQPLKMGESKFYFSLPLPQVDENLNPNILALCLADTNRGIEKLVAATILIKPVTGDEVENMFTWKDEVDKKIVKKASVMMEIKPTGDNAASGYCYFFTFGGARVTPSTQTEPLYALVYTHIKNIEPVALHRWTYLSAGPLCDVGDHVRSIMSWKFNKYRSSGIDEWDCSEKCFALFISMVMLYDFDPNDHDDPVFKTKFQITDTFLSRQLGSTFGMIERNFFDSEELGLKGDLAIEENIKRWSSCKLK